MGSVIKSYKAPKSAYELGRAVLLFLEDGLGFTTEDVMRGSWGAAASVDPERGGRVEVVVQDLDRDGERWVYLDVESQQILRAWEAAGGPSVEQIAFNLGDMGGALSPEAEAAARAVMASRCYDAIGWTPEEVARMTRDIFPDILQRVNLRRAGAQPGTPKDPGQVAEVVKVCMKAAFGLEAIGDADGLDIDLGGYGVVRMVVGRPEEFQVEAARQGAEFRPVKEYARPRSGEEFAESFAALAREELGMRVESFDVLGDPVSWINLSFLGLDARIDGVDVAVATDSSGLARVIAGEGEDELLKRYRAKLVALGMDPAEMSDCIPDGYAFDLLTADEAKAVQAFREGKALKKPRGKPKNRLPKNASKPAAGDRSYTPDEN